MSVQFYNSIIKEEKNKFNIKNETLKTAAKQVAKAYSKSALKEGLTYLDYNVPQNRCAYLFKYAAVHTQLVSKYFKSMIKHDITRFILEQRKELKICCLGGGPGTDVVGLFQVLATLPRCYQRVSEVTVLDLCGGWRNSFDHIISSLKHGKVENVPSKFLDCNFKADLIAVDLLEKLPDNVSKVIANADIICMVKFVSAILGKPDSSNALKAIGEKFKFGSIVLFIDNIQRTVFESLKNISRKTEYITILGPLKQVAYSRSSSKKWKKNPYGCVPQMNARVSVIGSIKTPIPPSGSKETENLGTHPEINCNSENDDSWDTDSDSENVCSDILFSTEMENNTNEDIQAQTTKNVNEIFGAVKKKICNKSTKISSKASNAAKKKNHNKKCHEQSTCDKQNTKSVSEISSVPENKNKHDEQISKSFSETSSATSNGNHNKICDEQSTKTFCDKFTQTQVKYFKKYQNASDSSISDEFSELPNLIAALTDLLEVMEKLKKGTKQHQCCRQYGERKLFN